MIIKLPAAYDLAGSYESVPDWSALDPKPLLVIHKATEGNFYQDAKCKPSLIGMAANGIRRGVYHYHRKAIAAVTQAQYFCNFIRGAINDNDLIVLDVEESGETAGQIINWLTYVQSQFPRNRLMIYSRKNILDPITTTTAQKDYLKQIPVWTAGYPTNPDNYTTPPAAYIPDQTRWGQVWLWQYSVKGIVSGIVGECDLDWIAPEFAALLGAPPPPVVTDGYQQIRRYDSDIHIWRGAVSRIMVTDNFGALIKPSYFAGAGAAVIINGDGWDKLASFPHLPLSLAVSEGRSVNDVQFDFRPFFNSKSSGINVISHIDDSEAKNLVSGTRYSVKAGVNPYTNSTDPEHVTERNPRTAIGYTIGGKLIACVVDGRSAVSAGVTLKELSDVMISAGASYALELDGGDSSIMLIDGLQVSHNGDPVNGARVERATVNSVLLFGDNMTLGKAKELLGKTPNIRSTPKITGLDVGDILPYSEITFEAIVDDLDHPAQPDYKWFRISAGKFTAYKYPRTGATPERFTILSMPTPTAPADKISVTITDNGVTKTYTISGDIVVS